LLDLVNKNLFKVGGKGEAVAHEKFFNHTDFSIDIQNGKRKTAMQTGCIWEE